MLFEIGKKYKVKEYKNINGNKPFKKWFDGLGNNYQDIVFKRIEAIKQGFIGNYKDLKGGLGELKFKEGIRIYFTVKNDVIIFLLSGGGKNTKKGQNADIEQARKYLKDLNEWWAKNEK